MKRVRKCGVHSDLRNDRFQAKRRRGHFRYLAPSLPGGETRAQSQPLLETIPGEPQAQPPAFPLLEGDSLWGRDRENSSSLQQSLIV